MLSPSIPSSQGLLALGAVLLFANKLGLLPYISLITPSEHTRFCGPVLLYFSNFDLLHFLRPFPSPPPTLGGGLRPSLASVHWVNLVMAIITLLCSS